MVRWGHGRTERWRCPPCGQKRRKKRHHIIEGKFGAPRLETPEPHVVIEDSDLTLYHGDCLDVLSALPDQSVHMAATSPPFYGLRDYGVDGQIGLEETPDEWCDKLVEVFSEVRRVLRDDGTLWVEIGDSYAANRTYQVTDSKHIDVGNTMPGRVPPGLKPKDMIGQPWLLAFALRADGWFLRSEIIWSKPNAMPESITDRPTKSHSTVFLLAKGQWKSRVVALSDLDGQISHLGEHVGSKDPNMWAHEFGIRLATAILDEAEFEDEFSLPSLDSEVWKEAPTRVDGVPIGDLPVIHRAAIYASRLLTANTSTKEFFCQLDRLGIALPKRGKFLVLGGSSEVPFPPGINRYGEGSIAIHDSGEIGEINLTTHAFKCSWPSGCSYYYDQDAIRQPFTDGNRGAGQGFRWNSPHYTEQEGPLDNTLGGLPPEPPRGPDGRRVTAVKGKENSHQHRDGERWPNADGANARTVWNIATEPTPFAHFATWPTKLVAKMIQAATSEKGCCPECGAPWVRELAGGGGFAFDKPGVQTGRPDGADRRNIGGGQREYDSYVRPQTVGWSPTCNHDHAPVPCTVLDPFAGSGTTLFVARALGRHSIGIELNSSYCKLAADRTQQLSLLT